MIYPLVGRYVVVYKLMNSYLVYTQNNTSMITELVGSS